MIKKSKISEPRTTSGKMYINGKLIGNLTNVEFNVETEKTVINVTDLTKTKSSNVYSVAFDSNSQTAFVKFNNGTLYKYEGVSEEEFLKLKTAKSVGSYLGKVFLKKGFGYKKLEDTELQCIVLAEEVLEETVKKNQEDFGKE